MSDGRNLEVRGWTTADDLAQGVAREIVELVAAVQRDGGVSDDGYARVVLTGGGAGGAVLRELAALDHAARLAADSFPVTSVDWNKVHVFFGDERFVPSGTTGATARNDELADAELLSHVGVPEVNVHRVGVPRDDEPADGSGLDAAAVDYAEAVAAFAPDGFDLHLLGMGPEGHVNSLFPHTDELTPEPGTLVVAVRDCPKPPDERVSLTLEAVHSSAEVWLLVTGEAKRQAAGEVVSGADPAQWPAAGVSGSRRTVLHVDAEADPR
ncbi:6-phosphogluconolactonase [Corynebacterium sp. USCH3]|uniref:6-phosphogluconolactonase n=1 Tax=Corynebacterium sp. USCH3 TaxID=3024840 RepID=UPI003097BF08